ncbi:Fc.00g092650.m01.CDS01 [Cosmosporella sp. VM-42]
MRMPTNHPAYEPPPSPLETDADDLLDMPFRLEGPAIGPAGEELTREEAPLLVGDEDLYNEDAALCVQSEIARILDCIQIMAEKNHTYLGDDPTMPVHADSFFDVAAECDWFVDKYMGYAFERAGTGLQQRLEGTILVDRRHGLGLRVIFLIVFGLNYAELNLHDLIYRSLNEVEIRPSLATATDHGTVYVWVRTLIGTRMKDTLALLNRDRYYADQLLQGVNQDNWLASPSAFAEPLRYLELEHLVWNPNLNPNPR